MNLLRRFGNWLQPRLPYLNIGLVVAAYLVNNYLIQGFCQLVPWVWWVLLPGVGAFLAWPWRRGGAWLGYLLLVLQGLLLPACLYCLWFARAYLLGALLTGFLVLPLLLWVPAVVGIQLLRRAWGSPLQGARWVMAAGALPLLLAQGWAWGQYQQVAAAVASLPPAQRHQAGPLLRVVPRSYMAERLAGQLFKYHASAEMIYDGWRPPLHDPLVNVCMSADLLMRHDEHYILPLLIGQWNPQCGSYWDSDINTQAAFYHLLFPNEPVKVACGCNVGGDGYYAWKPGLTDNMGAPLVRTERQQREF